jgi:uncharacterized membrane protein
VSHSTTARDERWKLLCSVWLVLTGACSSGGDPGDEPLDTARVTGASCDSGLDYESFGRGFMETYCTRCHSSALQGAARHSAPPDHDFDSFEKIVQYAVPIAEYAAAGPRRTNTFMPPSGAVPSPSLQQRQLLGSWLACGPTH